MEHRRTIKVICLTFCLTLPLFLLKYALWCSQSMYEDQFLLLVARPGLCSGAAGVLECSLLGSGRKILFKVSTITFPGVVYSGMLMCLERWPWWPLTCWGPVGFPIRHLIRRTSSLPLSSIESTTLEHVKGIHWQASCLRDRGQRSSEDLDCAVQLCSWT